MTRRTNGQTRQIWQERLARFATSGLTVEAFCQQENVSTASFYHWRRRLAEQAPPSASDGPPLFQAVTVGATAATLSIELPNGVRLQLPTDQLQLVRVVVAELAALAPSNFGAS